MADQPQPNPNAALPRPLDYALKAALISAYITFLILFTSWLLHSPLAPQFQADSLSLSSFNLTASPTSLLTATWNLRFIVRNPNYKVRYDQIEAAIFYKSKLLSVTLLPPLTQTKRSKTAVEVIFVADNAYVEDQMGKEMREKGSVEFNFRFLAMVRCSVWGWKAWRYLTVDCGGLQVVISGNGGDGSMTGGPRKCRGEWGSFDQLDCMNRRRSS